jgi:hypothetical protein
MNQAQRKRCRRCKCFHQPHQVKCRHWPLRYGPDWKAVKAELEEMLAELWEQRGFAS